VSTIQFYIATGQGIQLQGPPDDGCGLVLYRNIDGVQEADTIINTNNIAGFKIQSLSTINIQAAKNLAITTFETMILVGVNSTIIGTPLLDVLYNASISTINTNQISTNIVYSDFLVAYNALAATSTFTRSLLSEYISTGSLFSDNIRTIAVSSINISTGTIFTNVVNALNISTGGLFSDNIRTTAVSSINISTGTIFTNVVNALNISTGGLFSDNIRNHCGKQYQHINKYNRY
jgi:hypothetical protein